MLYNTVLIPLYAALAELTAVGSLRPVLPGLAPSCGTAVSSAHLVSSVLTPSLVNSSSASNRSCKTLIWAKTHRECITHRSNTRSICGTFACQIHFSIVSCSLSGLLPSIPSLSQDMPDCPLGDSYLLERLISLLLIFQLYAFTAGVPAEAQVLIQKSLYIFSDS